MLVLSRKLGQTFQIGGEVRITVVKIDRNAVRIGIQAPDQVTIQRQEIVGTEPGDGPGVGATGGAAGSLLS